MPTPWSSPMWEGDIVVALGVPADGWVQLAILSNAFNQSAVIHCSDIFDPFGDLLDWLRDVHAGVLPASVDINEEGYISKLAISANAVGDRDAEFTVTGFSGMIDEESKEMFKLDRQRIRCRVCRREIVSRFATTIVRWLKSDYNKFAYGMHGMDAEEAEEYGFDLSSRYLRGYQALASSASGGQKGHPAV